MGISMAGDGAFSYNRFDALNEAYSSLYEEKEEKDEDDVSDEEASAIKKEVKKHAKDMHSDDDESEDESEEEESEEESEDEEKSDKKFPSFLKKSKGEEVEGKLPKGTMKEEVIAYLMDEGFVNNEVSAEVMANHMSEEWRDQIINLNEVSDRKVKAVRNAREREWKNQWKFPYGTDDPSDDKINRNDKLIKQRNKRTGSNIKTASDRI
jgi:hypothetical protein